MINLIGKIKTYIKSHKKASVIYVIIIIILGYWLYGKIITTANTTRYVMGTVSKETVVSTVSGSGQVSALNQINLSPSVSGTITHIYVNSGDQVKKGKVLFAIDSADAEKAVRDASISLSSAKLDLETAKTQNENTDINQDTTIKNAYNNLLNSSFEATPSESISMSTTSSLQAPTISGNYILGKEGIINIHFYPSSGGVSFSASGLTTGSSIASVNFATPIGNSGLYLTLPSSNSTTSMDWVINIPNKKASNYVSNYNSYQNALREQKQNNSSSAVNLLNIQAKELAVAQKENALQDAKDNLSKYYITAPFDGTIASVPVIAGDNVGSSTTLGTIITPNKIANITLNEVDVAKIQLGEKVTLTFDAISDLTIAGKVVQIDSVGTVSSGVVNYTVKISFDTDDNRIKPGMSVNAAIITAVKQNVLTVPNGAVKTQNGNSYVQMFDTPLPAPTAGTQGSPSSIAPKNQTVQTGISNDTSTEIVSGLKEGDSIVTKTINSSTTTTSTAPSIFGAATGNRASGASAGGATRALTGR